MEVSYLILDIENNSSNRYGKKAGNPFYDEIVAIGMKNNLEIHAEYIYPNKPTILTIDEELLVGHNLSHDLGFLWHLDSIQEFFKNGGRIWDTQLAEYILTGQQHKYAALRDLAVNKYGCPDRVKHIERLLFNKDATLEIMKSEFEQATAEREGFIAGSIREEIKHVLSYKQVSDLPRAAVLEDVKNDVLDTEQVFLKQYQLVIEKQLHDLIALQMDALCATIEMSYNGMKIDRKVLNRNKLKLENELVQKKHELDLLVKGVWK